MSGEPRGKRSNRNRMVSPTSSGRQISDGLEARKAVVSHMFGFDATFDNDIEQNSRDVVGNASVDEESIRDRPNRSAEKQSRDGSSLSLTPDAAPLRRNTPVGPRRGSGDHSQHQPGAFSARLGNDIQAQTKGILTPLQENSKVPEYRHRLSGIAINAAMSDFDSCSDGYSQMSLSISQPKRRMLRLIVSLVVLLGCIVAAVVVLLSVNFDSSGRGGGEKAPIETNSCFSGTNYEDFVPIKQCECQGYIDTLPKEMMNDYTIMEKIIRQRLFGVSPDQRRALSNYTLQPEDFFMPRNNMSDCSEIRNIALWTLVWAGVTDIQFYAMLVTFANLGILQMNQFNSVDFFCLWQGVQCDDSNRVVGINLGLGLVLGSMPPEIGLLANLEFIFLNQNVRLVGSIPSEIGMLTKLEQLDFSESSLGGTIPTEVGNLRSLKSFSATETRLAGSIPTELCDATSLVNLGLAASRLEGRVPVEILKLKSLVTLDLSQNRLSGWIPTQLRELTNLAILSLGDNQYFEDTELPSCLWEMTDLTILSLPSLQLAGTIPNLGLANLTKLETLSLFGNSLSGTIPTEIGLMRNLTYMSAGLNSLSGSLPSEVGNLGALYSLDLSSNRLEDLIPTEIEQLSSLKFLDLSGNILSGSLEALCQNRREVTNMVVDGAIECSCCTLC